MEIDVKHAFLIAVSSESGRKAKQRKHNVDREVIPVRADGRTIRDKSITNDHLRKLLHSFVLFANSKKGYTDDDE